MPQDATFAISCYGRDANGNTVLPEPVQIICNVRQSTEWTISIDVTCPYSTRGHRERCKASHPETDKIGEGVACPYSLDIPYALDKKIIVRGNKVSRDV